jgi:hypothetical protein
MIGELNLDPAPEPVIVVDGLAIQINSVEGGSVPAARLAELAAEGED